MSAWSDYVAAIPNLIHWWRFGEPAPPYADSVGTPAVTVTAGTVESVGGLLPFDDNRAVAIQPAGRITFTMADNPPQWSAFGILATALVPTAQTNVMIRAGGGAVSLTLRTDGRILNAGPALPGIGTLPVVNDGLPHLWAQTYDGTNLTLTVDGESRSGASTVDSMNGTFNLGGAAATTWPGPPPLTLDEFAIAAHAMSAQEVADLWTAMHTPLPPTAPQNVTATPGLRSATVSWDPPASDGGTPVTEYVVEWEEVSGA